MSTPPSAETPLEAARDAVPLTHVRGCSWQTTLGGEHDGCDCGAVDRLDALIAEARSEATELRKAAQNIYDVTASLVICPHGNRPSYPTHALWCDGCWERLARALTPADPPTMICGECEEHRPDDARVAAGMKCGQCQYKADGVSNE